MKMFIIGYVCGGVMMLFARWVAHLVCDRKETTTRPDNFDDVNL